MGRENHTQRRRVFRTDPWRCSNCASLCLAWCGGRWRQELLSHSDVGVRGGACLTISIMLAFITFVWRGCDPIHWLTTCFDRWSVLIDEFCRKKQIFRAILSQFVPGSLPVLQNLWNFPQSFLTLIEKS